jgi:hypothetical protein
MQRSSVLFEDRMQIHNDRGRRREGGAWFNTDKLVAVLRGNDTSGKSLASMSSFVS